MIDPRSLPNLAQAHPLHQQLWRAVGAKTDIIILDAQRGREAQEEAFRKGASHAHFGESAHNYIPALALDVVPDHDPDLNKRLIRWEHVQSFLDLNRIVMEEAAKLDFVMSGEFRTLRWGGDWDGDGDRTDQTLNDLPHYELNPWRLYVARGDVKLIGS